MTNETDLITRLIQKDETALAELVEQYAGLLTSVIRRQLYALPGHEEECLNDVLLAIWQNCDQYDAEQASFKNWICAIARYRAINFLRKYRNDLTLVAIDKHELPHEETPFAKELWEIELMELLAPLQEKDRLLFKDIVEKQFTTEEIASKHGLSVAALYSRFSRGKAKLQDFFQRKGVKDHEK